MKSGTAKLLAAFLAGAAAGASLGILLAPDKGSETRKKIKDKLSALGEKATQAYKKIRGKKDEDEVEE